MEIKISFILTLREFISAMLLNVWSRRKKRLIRNLLISISGSFLWSYGFKYHLDAVKALIFTGIFVPVFFLGYVPFILVLSLICSWFQYTREPKFHQEILWSFKPEGAFAKTPFSDGNLQWAAFREFVETKEFFLLYITQWQFYIIPKRALTGEDDEQRLHDLFNERIFKK